MGQATGTSGWQLLFKIRLPFALPSIMTGVNQCLMMAFCMVVMAGIIGTGGLGEAIYGIIRTLNIAKSIDAAIAISHTDIGPGSPFGERFAYRNRGEQ